MLKGQVIKLDRGYPLVRTDEGACVRCEHATALVKGEEARAAIGDFVELSLPSWHDKGIIERILPRSRVFVRKDPTERAQSQVLASNFDRVIVAQPLSDVNVRRLERELVLAHETGAAVAVVLTKSDLADDERQVAQVRGLVSELVESSVDVVVVSDEDPESIEAVRALIPPGETAVLLGKSGVGKSSLVNMLVGDEVQETAHVREGDGKGRHTTVSREMVDVPGGGRIVDMPGVRGLGLWEADAGIGAAFADIEERASHCRFRDCRHVDEPGCAVIAAVRDGDISVARLASYRALKDETDQVRARREEARRLRGQKASDSSGHSSRKGRPRKKR